MRDAKTENYLTKGNYIFRFVENYDLSRINLSRALQNPARLHRSLDEKRVDAMALGMIAGDDFPAIVVFGNSDDTIDDLVTGAHRCAAADRAERKALDAYVILEHDPFRRALLPRSINILEGRGQTHEESLAIVAEILRMFPDTPQTELAAAFSLRQHAISEHMRLIDYEARAEMLGVGDTWVRLTQGIRKEIGRIVNDNAFRETIQVLARTRINGKPASELVDAVRRARSEVQANQLLEKTMQGFLRDQERLQSKFGRKGSKSTTTGRWFTRLRSLWRFLPHWDVSSLHLSSIDASAVPASIMQVEEVLDQLDEVLAVLKALQVQKEKERQWREQGANGETQSAGILPLA